MPDGAGDRARAGDARAGDARPADPSDVLGMIAAGAARRMNGENFPVALRALPRAVRDDLAATYVFARFVDEIGDSAPGGPDARLALLDLVTADLDALPERATLPPVAGLARMVTEHDVPLDPFRELVEANRLDQRRSSYADLAELLGYCRLAAAPVGRIVLYRAGAADDRSIARSDDVCAALQILEHCQDVGEDARAGRVYLPQDSLAAERVAPERLRGGITPPGLRRVVAEQVARSRELLRSGPPLVRGLHGWARLAVAGYVAGGLATADALDAADHDVLAVAVRPSTARTLRHALRLLAGRPGRDGRSA